MIRTLGFTALRFKEKIGQAQVQERQMTKINPHWSFWVVAVVALLWFGFGVLSFLQISFSEFTDSSGAERSYFEYMSMWTPPVTELFVEQLRLTSNMVIRDGVIDPGTDKYSVG